MPRIIESSFASGDASRSKEIYRAVLPFSARHKIYTMRQREELKDVRRAVTNVSSKGVFSLRRCDELRAIFVHVPKAAGTAISKAIFGDLIDHYTCPQYKIIFGRKDYARYYKFTFVRDPWARVYSAYKYLMAGGWGEYEGKRALDLIGEYSSFNEFVCNWLDSHNIERSVHFWPQHIFLSDICGSAAIDNIYRYESLDLEFARLCSVLGVDAHLEKINATPGSSAADYRDHYTSRAVDRVYALYKRDIRLLKYEF